MDSGGGAQAPWLRNAIPKGMQASLDFGQFSILEGGKDFNWSGFSPSITKFRPCLPGAACLPIHNHREPAILVVTWALVPGSKTSILRGQEKFGFLREASSGSCTYAVLSGNGDSQLWYSFPSGHGAAQVSLEGVLWPEGGAADCAHRLIPTQALVALRRQPGTSLRGWRSWLSSSQSLPHWLFVLGKVLS